MMAAATITGPQLKALQSLASRCFSGETEEDHQATIHALSEIRYDSAYIYKYSIRAQTPAAKLPDDVPLSLKESRNQELLKFQKGIEQENNRKQLGKVIFIFVEKTNPRVPGQLIGRTDQEKTVAFLGPESLIGHFQKVQLTDLHNETLIGSLA